MGMRQAIGQPGAIQANQRFTPVASHSALGIGAPASALPALARVRAAVPASPLEGLVAPPSATEGNAGVAATVAENVDHRFALGEALDLAPVDGHPQQGLLEQRAQRVRQRQSRSPRIVATSSAPLPGRTE